MVRDVRNYSLREFERFCLPTIISTLELVRAFRRRRRGVILEASTSVTYSNVCATWQFNLEVEELDETRAQLEPRRKDTSSPVILECYGVAFVHLSVLVQVILHSTEKGGDSREETESQTATSTADTTKEVVIEQWILQYERTRASGYAPGSGNA
eukprot:1055551-Pyramimonas_sp.AAC.2